MVTSAATDVTYIGRPKWSVAHHLSAAGVPSPSKLAAAQRLSRRHRLLLLAASVAIGIVLAAIYFAFIQVKQEVQVMHDAAKPWAAAAVEANKRKEAPAVDMPPQQPTSSNNSVQTQVQATSSSTSVVINGEQVPLPEDGTIHKTYTNGSSQSTVDIKINRSTGP